MVNCNHPKNKTYRDISCNNVLRCGICNKILTTKIGDDDNRNKWENRQW